MGNLLGGLIRGIFSIFGGIFGLLFGGIGRFLLPLILVGAIMYAVLNPTVLKGFAGILSGGKLSVVSAPVVVTQIRGMSTLVTASFASQVNVEVKKEGLFSFLPSERMMLRAEGTILAGVDLTKITEADVTVSGSTVTIRIPPAKIVSQDMRYAQVLTDQGILPGIDPTMQSAAEEKGRAELLKAACDNYLLNKAEQEAQVALGDLLGKLDVDQVSLVQTKPQLGESTGCP